MAATSFSLILMLLLGPIAGGQLPNDVAANLDPSDYFFSRRIEGGPKSMLELAGKKPSTPSDVLAQLLAIRWLSENPDKLAEHKDATLKALKQLAEGPAGFATDYAQRGIARLEGKPLPIVHSFAKGSVRGEALSWFPEDVNLFGAYDLRALPGQKAVAKDEELDKLFQRLRGQAMKALPPDAKEEIYKFAESVGNVRIDRVAAGYAPNASDQGKSRIYVRFTGQADHQGLVAFLSRTVPDAQTEELKGPSGEPITLIHGKRPPAFAIVGDTDMIMAGYQRNEEGSVDLVKQTLDIRAGKKPSVVKGAFAKDLEEAPEDASGVGRGVPPPEIQTGIAQSPVGVSPLRVALDVVNSNASGKGLVVSFRAAMVNEADAKKFADGMNGIIKMAREEIKQAPLGVKKELLDELGKLVDAIEFKATGATVGCSLTVSPKTQRSMIELIEAMMKMELRDGP
jgi:hypothetical protein